HTCACVCRTEQRRSFTAVQITPRDTPMCRHSQDQGITLNTNRVLTHTTNTHTPLTPHTTFTHITHKTRASHSMRIEFSHTHTPLTHTQRICSTFKKQD